MSRRLLRRNPDGSRVPNLKALTGDSGVLALDPYLTINSVTKAPSLLYRGGDADGVAKTWPAVVGETLTETGSGASCLYGQPALGNGAGDMQVRNAGGKYLIGSDPSVGDIDVDDFAVEYIFYRGLTSTDDVIIYYRDSTGPGWQMKYIASTSKINTYIYDSSSSAVQLSGVVPCVAGTALHVMTFGDRSGYMQTYINGADSGGAVLITGVSGSLHSAVPVQLCRLGGAGLSHFALWQGAGWLDTHLQADLAKERFQKWAGIWPSRATGTDVASFARASTAYAKKWNGTAYDLINCGAGLPRVDYVLDASGRDFKGCLVEPQATNKLTYSEDSTQWTALDAGDTLTADDADTPDRRTVVTSLIADATDGQHGAQESNAPTLTAAKWTYSRFMAAGGNGFAYLEDETVANTRSYFDLVNGTVASEGSAADARIDGPYYSDIGDMYRCEITFDGTVAAHTLSWGSAVAADDVDFAGDGASKYIYTFGAQVELGTKASSYILTEGAEATRASDKLSYNGDNVTASTGAAVANVLVDTHTPAGELSVVHISDGGSADEAIRMYVDAGTNVPIFSAVDSTVAQWTITGATDVIDGDSHQVRGTWKTNSAKLRVDRAADGTPDTSCTVPTGIDEIDVGQDVSETNQLNGRLRNLAVWGWDEEVIG